MTQSDETAMRLANTPIDTLFFRSAFQPPGSSPPPVSGDSPASLAASSVAECRSSSLSIAGIRRGRRPQACCANARAAPPDRPLVRSRRPSGGTAGILALTAQRSILSRIQTPLSWQNPLSASPSSPTTPRPGSPNASARCRSPTTSSSSTAAAPTQPSISRKPMAHA